jgi:glycosyltransferase involved in cell wall biosynthesis
VAPDRVSVAISTYRQPRQLDACLRALSEGSVLPGEILIADDGSGEETAAVVREWSERLPIPVEHCWHEDQGHWKARAGNLALARSSLDYVLILDCDCMPTRPWVEDHAALAERGCYVQGRRFQIAEAAVPRFLESRPGLFRLFLTGGLRNIKHAIRLPRPLVYRDRALERTISANFAAWREDLVAVNGWNEAFRSWGSEDWELAARLRNLGRKRKFVRGWAAVGHLNHPLRPRDPDLMAQNLAILEETVSSGRTWCDEGLDQHLQHPGGERG